MRSTLAIAATVWLLATGVVAAGPFTALGRPPAAPRKSAPVSTDLLLALPEPEARKRIDAAMDAQGFEPSDAAKLPSQLAYVRFGDQSGFRRLADCQGPAVGSPKMWIETLIVDLHPEPAGVRVVTTGQFRVILNSLISGAPFKLTCRSRGVLEGEIRAVISKG